MPEELEDSEIEVTAQEARFNLEQEAIRTKDPQTSDPAGSKLSLEKLGLKRLKDKFPFLMEYTDSFIMEAGVHNLIKAEKAARQLKDMERNNRAEDRLFSNREQVDSACYPVEAGSDNRLSSLHPARCLPGAVCSAGKLWLHARSILGNKGHPPPSLPTTCKALAWVALCLQKAGSKFMTPVAPISPSNSSPWGEISPVKVGKMASFRIWRI